MYDGDIIQVRRDTVRLPDGSQGQRTYVRHPGAVAIVALFDDGSVLLERQFRYPHGRDFIEIPAGRVEPGEPRLDTAKRELLEETGTVAGEWRSLGVVHPTIGYSDEAIELFVARQLTRQEAKLDPGEFLEALRVPFAEALEMIREGRITDAKTIAGLLWVKAFLP